MYFDGLSRKRGLCACYRLIMDKRNIQNNIFFVIDGKNPFFYTLDKIYRFPEFGDGENY